MRRDRKLIPLTALFSQLAAALLAMVISQQPANAADLNISRIQADAERGSVQREIQLGAAYLIGHGVPKDERQAAYWYERAANSGDPGAQQQIAYFYATGIGVERSPERAAEWFQRAVAGGSVSAKVNLGVAYVWGQGVRKDPQFGVQLFREAAEKGSGIGACFLGDSYHFGIGVAKDDSKAMHWFEVGAKRHDARAAYDAAYLLLHRSSREGNEKAMKYLRESASGGYVMAKHQLALELIHREKPVPSASYDEAIDLLQKASADGFWRSSAILGILYRDGQGMQQDKQAAYYHFRIAELQGGNEATALLAREVERLKKDLGGPELLTLDEKATVWAKDHSRSLEYVGVPRGLEQTFPALAVESPTSDAHAGVLNQRAGRDAMVSGTDSNSH